MSHQPVAGLPESPAWSSMAADGNYQLTCTPGRVAVRSNRRGNCATVTVHTVVLRKFRAACVSK